MRTVTLCAALALSACNRAPDEPHSTPGLGASAPPSVTADNRPSRVSARHVLVMFRGSQHAPETIRRTREEARVRAQEVLTHARQGEDFAALARQYSDEPGAATSGGDLGNFGHGQMVPVFERAAFALNVGQVSDIVESEFGFHVIKRTQ